MSNILSNWDERFLQMANLVSSWSKDPSTQVGAIIADQKNRVISIGFNGFPRGVEDNFDSYRNREEKYRKVQHAERNAILFAQRDLSGCIIYVTPMPPCAQCAGMIIQAGISRVVTIKPTQELYSRWSDDIQASYSMFNEAGVEVCLKRESI